MVSGMRIEQGTTSWTVVSQSSESPYLLPVTQYLQLALIQVIQVAVAVLWLEGHQRQGS